MANEFKVKKGLIVQGSGSTLLDIQGSQGQLFSVTDSLSGSLFSVNDISGMPIMEVFSDDRVLLGTFNAEAIKVSGSTASVTGSLLGTSSYAAQALSASYSISSSNALTASFVVSSSFAISSSRAVTSSFAISSSNALTASFITSSNVFGPNGSNSILSASFAISSSRAVSSSNALTASFVLSSSYAVSSSNALTASFVNTLTQNVLITGSLTVGSSSLGASENTITLGARDTASEGGQIGFNAPGGTYTSASFIDNWQNKARILKGNNTTSTGLLAQWDIHTTQLQLPGYTAASSFPGTATANLAVDSGGNVITVSTSGGSVFPYTGNAVITGSLTTTGIIYAQPNGGMYFQGGDDAALYDINVANTMGIYGMQDSTVGAIKLGSSGPVLYGSGSSLGIGTTNPSSASLTVSGNVWATSFTGSLFGTASRAVSASQALSASWAPAPTNTFLQNGNSFGTTASLGTNDNTPLYFETNGTTKMAINTNGRVGIGTTNPQGTIDVFGGDSRFGLGNNGYVVISDDNVGGELGVMTNQDEVIAIKYSDGTFRYGGGTTSTTPIIVSQSNVGIGITNPIYTLDVSSPTARFGQNANGYVIISDDNYGGELGILTHQDEVIAIKYSDGTFRYGGNNPGAEPLIVSASNVGIGTTTPNTKLDVNGNAIITGSLTVTGRITAEEFHTEFVSSSIIYLSGSTKFGDSLDDVMSVTGSLRVNGGITGSLFGTSSWAVSASWAPAPTNAFVQNGNSFGTTALLGTNDNNSLALETSGSTRMFISSSGNIGIGTTTPQRKLDVLSGANNFVSVGIDQIAVGQWAGVHFGYAEGANNLYRKSAIIFERTDLTSNNAQGKVHILNGPQGNANSATLADSKLTINEAGNVGIGTTTPSQLLEVNGNALIKTAFIGTISAFGDNYTSFSHISRTGSGDYSLLSDNAGATYLNAKPNQTIRFRIDNTDKAILSSSGDFGINTTTPNAKLDVNGNAIITGSLTVTGRITAEEFHTEFVSSSIIYLSGSTKFGDSSDDVMSVTGSLRVNGGITGSLFGTASWAVSASWAPATETAATASFVTSSNVFGPNGSNSILSASFATTSSVASNITVTNTVSGAGPYYVMFADGTTGNRVARVDSGNLTFNSDSNTLTVSNLAGNASTATVAGKITQENTSGTGTYYMMMTQTAVGGDGRSYNTSNQTDPIYYDAATAKLYSKYFVGEHQGSLVGTASWAVSASFAVSSSRAVTSSFTISSSNALTASYVNTLVQPVILTGSFNQGLGNVVLGLNAHAEGSSTRALAEYSHAEGVGTIASGSYSHAEGINTVTSGSYSHAEGSGTKTSGNYTHAEGIGSQATAEGSHAEGANTTASGFYSHAEGSQAQATGQSSHAEGTTTQAKGTSSHAEGINTLASGSYSHAEGDTTVAQGYASHAEGVFTHALGDYSHAAGNYTSASGNYQSVVGQYNLPLTTPGAFIIGNGIGTGANRSNLLYTSGSQVQVTGSVIATRGFTGSLQGTASYASQSLSASFATAASTIAITNDNATNTTYYPIFTTGISGNLGARVDNATLTYNPGTNTLTTTTFAGNATTATTASNATNATNVTITTQDTTPITYNITFTGGTSGNNSLAVDSTTLTYNPSTSTFTTPIVNSTTAVRGGNGSVSLPAFSFSGDTDTGIYNAAANVVGIAGGGVGIAFISQSGFHMQGPGNKTIELTANSAGDTEIVFAPNTTGGTGGNLHVNHPSLPLIFKLNSTERWRIVTAGTLQSNGASTIQTSTGNLTLATAGGNGNIVFTPNGTGTTTIANGGTNYSSSVGTSAVNGELAYWGGGSVTAGNVYFYSSTGNWELADADAAVSSSGMLGIAQSTGTASTVGMLLRGHARFTGVTSYTGATTIGAPLYVSQTAGAFTQTAPTGTGKVVRIIGYVQSTANDQIYFCPDTTWVELA